MASVKQAIAKERKLAKKFTSGKGIKRIPKKLRVRFL